MYFLTQKAMKTTLTESTFRRFDFSDNPYYIYVPEQQYGIASNRIQKFFARESNELKFSDIEGIEFVKKNI